jgi:hypothetical protein
MPPVARPALPAIPADPEAPFGLNDSSSPEHDATMMAKKSTPRHLAPKLFPIDIARMFGPMTWRVRDAPVLVLRPGCQATMLVMGRRTKNYEEL